MADTTTGAPRTPRKRGEGQWALGYYEPLNNAEQVKKEDDGLNVRERIERIFAPGGFRSISKGDLRSRMRWWGLYTQRKQGVPAERTGSAEPEELEDEFFMLRVRIDGGVMTSEQLRAIAWASETVRARRADVTDRQNVQLHWIRIEDVPGHLRAARGRRALARRRPAATLRACSSAARRPGGRRRGVRRHPRHPCGRHAHSR